MESNIAGDAVHGLVGVVDGKAKEAIEALGALEDVAIAAGQSGLTVIDKTADNLLEEIQGMRERLAVLAHELADVVGKREEPTE